MQIHVGKLNAVIFLPADGILRGRRYLLPRPFISVSQARKTPNLSL